MIHMADREDVDVPIDSWLRGIAANIHYLGPDLFKAWARATIDDPCRLGGLLGQDDTPENRRLLGKILWNLARP